MPSSSGYRSRVTDHEAPRRTPSSRRGLAGDTCRLEEFDPLRDIFIEYFEVAGGQPRHRLTAIVHDDCIDSDQGRLGAEARLRIRRLTSR